MQYSRSFNSIAISPSISYLTISNEIPSPRAFEPSQIHRIVVALSRSLILRWEVMRRHDSSSESRRRQRARGVHMSSNMNIIRLIIVKA